MRMLGLSQKCMGIEVGQIITHAQAAGSDSFIEIFNDFFAGLCINPTGHVPDFIFQTFDSRFPHKRNYRWLLSDNVLLESADRGPFISSYYCL